MSTSSPYSVECTVYDTSSGWWSSTPSISNQPGTRTLTVSSYRGNNTTFTFAIPSSTLVAGENTLIIYVVSGSGNSGYLSAGYAFDCVDLLQIIASPRVFYRQTGKPLDSSLHN